MAYCAYLRHHCRLWLVVLLLGCMGVVAPAFAQVDTAFVSSDIFIPKSAYKSGQENWGIASADMNRDGFVDIITCSRLDGCINVHYNNGTGDFSAKKSFRSQPQLRSLCAFDANGDGWTDIASISTPGRLAIMMNDKSGQLLPATEVITTGESAQDITAADINEDGKIDLLVTIVKTDAVNIHYGLGGGGFRDGVPIYTGDQPRSVKVGDLNGDKHPDIVVGCDDGRLYVFMNNGTGVFSETSRIALRSGAANWGLGIADLDNDGDLDIASASYEDRKLCIHLNQKDGSFAAEQCVVSGDHNFELVISDFNMDGNLDIVTASSLDRLLNVHLNKGKGVFYSREGSMSGDWNSGVVAADVDGDGDWDAVTSSINDNNINVHRNLTFEQRDQSKRPACIVGYVREAATQRVLSRAPVVLVKEDGTSENTFTDQNGFYKFCPEANKKYILKVRVEGMPIYKGEVLMPNEEFENDIYLKEPTGAVVYGKVLNIRNNAPIAGVEVEIRDKSRYLVGRVKTNIKGGYLMEVPFGTEYTLMAAHPTFDSARKSLNIVQEDANKQLRNDIILSPEKPPFVFGKIMDVETEQPVGQAKVEVKDLRGVLISTAISDDQGKYSCFLPYGDGDYNLYISSVRYEDGEAKVSIQGQGGSRRIRQDIPILPKAQPLIYGTFINDDTDKPIVGGLVQIRDLQNRVVGSAISDAKGNYKHAFPFADSRYRLTAVVAGFDTLRAEVVIQKTDGNKRFLKDFRFTPEKAAMFYGTIRREDTKEPMENAKVMLLNRTTNKATPPVVSDEAGRFEASLDFGAYEAIVTANSTFFLRVTFLMAVEDLKKGKSIIIDMKPIKAGANAILEQIAYKQSDTTLVEDSRPELQRVLELLKNNSSIVAEIAVHTDNEGAPDQNIRLSQGRANEVMRYLRREGIAAERLQAKGYGSSEPIAPNDSPENRAINRRTELRIKAN